MANALIKEVAGTEEFDAAIGAGTVLVDFWASWCGPCKAIAPIVEEIAGEYEGRLKVVKVNIDEDGNQEVAARFGVMSIPTLIVFKDGAEAEKAVGMRPKAMLTEMIAKHI